MSSPNPNGAEIVNFADPDGDYTRIHNQILRGKTKIQSRYVGVWGYIASHAKGWVSNERQVASALSVGREFVRNALDNIESAGFLVRHRERDSKGRLGAGKWFITDLPLRLADVDITDPEIVAEKVRSQYTSWLEQHHEATGGSLQPRPGRPESGFPTQVDTDPAENDQTRRSEPKSAQPNQAEPDQADRTTKKTKNKKTNEKKTNTPPSPPADGGGSAAAPDSTGGGDEPDTGGGLMPMSEILPVRSRSSRRSTPATRGRAAAGGEMVSAHGRNAGQIIDVWKETLPAPGMITGRLRTDLIKAVRGVLTESPGAQDWHLKEALDEYLRIGNHPNFVAVAYRTAQTRAARAANVTPETPRQRAEREHYERVATGQPTSPAALEQARAAAWGTRLEQVPTAPARSLWCEHCDPDSPGWLPPVDPLDPAEKPRKCPHHGRSGFKPSSAEVRAFARDEFDARYAAHHNGDHGDDGDVVDAEIV